APYLLLRVEFVALLLEAANTDHAAQEGTDMVVVQLHPGGHLAFPSSVDRSPSGRPSSRARRRRRMILPERVRGRLSRKTISRGATAGPSRLRAWPRNSRSSASSGANPAFSVTKALTTSPAVSSGMPITAASATAGCSISTLSTSKGPIRCPEDLIR